MGRVVKVSLVCVAFLLVTKYSLYSYPHTPYLLQKGANTWREALRPFTGGRRNLTWNSTESEMNITRYRPSVNGKEFNKSIVTELLYQQRMANQKELEGYKLHKSLKAKDISQLIPEEGGTPVRNLVVTTWRSGSTFLGDILLSHPATYYHYEPLLDIGIRQARYGELAETSVKSLNQLMKCNYTGLDHYLDYGKDHSWLLNHNRRLWWVCIAFRHLCEDQNFLSQFCELFSFQSLKVVRLRMNLTETFLLDPSLDVRIVLLVRDPRGTIQSRSHRSFCPGNEDCENPAKLCDDLVSDFYSAKKLTRQFPGKIRVIRYEDLSFNTKNYTEDLFEFFRLSYVDQVHKFLESHTQVKRGGVSSTFRDSKTAPVHWRTDLSFDKVKSIQGHCKEAMQLYGYIPALNGSHLVEFSPIGAFQFEVT